MGGTHTPRWLMDHIGFGPRGSRWALGGPFRNLGVRGDTFCQFWNALFCLMVQDSSKLWQHDFLHPYRCGWRCKKDLEILSHFRDFGQFGFLLKSPKWPPESHLFEFFHMPPKSTHMEVLFEPKSGGAFFRVLLWLFWAYFGQKSNFLGGFQIRKIYFTDPPQNW